MSVFFPFSCKGQPVKTERKQASIGPETIPPYCHLTTCDSAEEAAAEAMRSSGSRHAADALAILWQLRRVAALEQAERL